MIVRCFILILMLAVEPALAQTTPPASTSNTDFNKKARNSQKKSNVKKIRYLLKRDTQHTSYGNPCVVEITRSKGFEYLVTLKGQPGYESEAQRGLHNFTVNIALLFRNGPFWKSGLRKKIEDCRQKSGDYVG
ncbi:MAG: hypothetical protein DHS20C17_33820 [Cyclobacteriaceae bacterium]|nr:MAG: hypothetical protein DHS20C17_33820 [Cyclobacteriaceae bacterium]